MQSSSSAQVFPPDHTTRAGIGCRRGTSMTRSSALTAGIPLKALFGSPTLHIYRTVACSYLRGSILGRRPALRDLQVVCCLPGFDPLTTLHRQPRRCPQGRNCMRSSGAAPCVCSWRTRPLLASAPYANHPTVVYTRYVSVDRQYSSIDSVELRIHSLLFMTSPDEGRMSAVFVPEQRCDRSLR